MTPNSPPLAAPSNSPLLAYLRLCRIGNVFTALADILAGYTIAHGLLTPSLDLFALLATSALIYTAGMVLNDWFDVERDRVARADRPIPSGVISRGAAGRLGWGLLATGVIAAGFAASPSSGRFAPLGVVAILAVCVVLYDGLLKATWMGPFAMGACRGLNMLLGMSTVGSFEAVWQQQLWIPAAGMLVYVAGITTFARHEASGGARTGLGVGLFLMVTGVAVLGCTYRGVSPARPLHLPSELAWWCLLMLIMFPVGRRALAAIGTPQPARIQRTVGLAITTLVVLDASVALLMGGSIPAIVTIAMLFPAMAIMRWVPPT